MTTRQHLQAAATAAQARCERDATPHRFAEHYRRECNARDLDPDATPDDRPMPLLRCPACGQTRALDEFEAVDDEVVEDLQRFRRRVDALDERTRGGPYARRAQFAREEQAAEAAQKQCEADGEVYKFAERYREQLARIT